MALVSRHNRLVLHSASATHIGQRELNEDSAAALDEMPLYVVADGAGGHNAGEVASALAVRSIVEFFDATRDEAADEPEFDVFGLPKTGRRLSRAVHEANRKVTEVSQSNSEHRGMGTTVVAIGFSVHDGLVHVANVGDSRCYRMRDGHFEQLTQDHSLLTDVIEVRPDLDDYQLARLPSSVITRALGVSVDLRVSLRSYGAVAGDRYLLCSDGLSGALPVSEIAERLAARASLERIADDLATAAVDAGGKDNVTALIIECRDGPSSVLPPSVLPSADDREPELLILGIEEIELDDELLADLRDATTPWLTREKKRP